MDYDIATSRLNTFTPSDLMDFYSCSHLTWLRVRGGNITLSEKDLALEMIIAKGVMHEKAYLELLKEEYSQVTEIKNGLENERVQATLQAMQEGYDVIYQPHLRHGNLRGKADFLIKVRTPSRLGDHSYEALDTKLALQAKTEHILQLCFYSEILSFIQGHLPEQMHLVTGNREKLSYDIKNYYGYFLHLKKKFLEFTDCLPRESEGKPCDKCSQCDYRDYCNAQWEGRLHRIANIRQSQIAKLEKQNIRTIKEFAEYKGKKITGISAEAYDRLKRQAELQYHKYVTGKDRYELIDQALRSIGEGFSRLPAPDAGDLFFDMEGHPLYEEKGHRGLEYLFGIYYIDKSGKANFKDIWAHNIKEEKEAFCEFIEFVSGHLQRYPKAHIYHYNHYEETAIKRLMSIYVVKEAEVDYLLREGKLIDLYKVVRKGLMVSEPKYSIKNLEHFYMEKRDEALKAGGDSIAFFENWLSTGDNKWKQDIYEYNKQDCKSTYLLREWLISIKPAGIDWYTSIKKEEGANQSIYEIEKTEDCELRAKLLSGGYNAEEMNLRTLLYYLGNFYKREDKPTYWAYYERQTKDYDELLEDSEAIIGLKLREEPKIDKRSKIYTYEFPEQEVKLQQGDKVVLVNDPQQVLQIYEINYIDKVLKIRTGKGLPKSLSLMAGMPHDNKLLRQAVRRYIDSYINKEQKYNAATQILRKDLPDFIEGEQGKKVIIDKELQSLATTIENLNNSYLCIQGPPGTGKTYIAANMILYLLGKNKKIGIVSNSHKAINNVLHAVEKYNDKNVEIKGIKKGYESPEEFNKIQVTNENKINIQDYNLIAGTSWLFAREDFDQQIDYLFIDEAGQMSIANTIAAGLSARNIILVGDQMQLPQPLQGSHPGESGLSVFEYILQGRSTIPEEQGAFLDESRRLNPDICTVISKHIYDGRLKAHIDNQYQQLILNDNPYNLRSKGIQVISMDHNSCSSSSKEEARKVKEVAEFLVTQEYQSRNMEKKSLTFADILVVAPFNAQVNLLKSILPSSVRVGTVDRFQGQEAEVVIVSMTTSDEETLPRDREFLFSKRRLNVALTRARCLALIIMNNKLLDIKCKEINDMEKLSLFCELKYCSGREEDYAINVNKSGS